jgi:hypothetical protein
MFHFFMYFIAASLAFIISYWVLLLIPAFLSEHIRSSSIIPVAYLLSNIIAIYLLCAWPAFSILFTRHYLKYVDAFRWVYYLSAFLFIIAGSALAIRIVMREPTMKDAEEADEFFERYCSIESLRGFLFASSIIATIVFLIWPAFANVLYGWIFPRSILG